MLKKVIEQKTGIPSELLTSETEKGTIEQARALLAYKKQCEEQREKTSSEQFTDWYKEQTGTVTKEDPAEKALDEIEEASRLYPAVTDAGEVDHRGLPDGKSTGEHFQDWLQDQIAWNPHKTEW